MMDASVSILNLTGSDKCLVEGLRVQNWSPNVWFLGGQEEAGSVEASRFVWRHDVDGPLGYKATDFLY